MMIDNLGGFPTVILAHGSGSPMDSHFLNVIAEGLAEAGAEVIRFEFPYMARRRHEGTNSEPNPTTLLLDTWRDVVSNYDPSTIFIGGKSLGGRIASLLADELGVRGLICLGYPFHTPGKPEDLRTAHLEKLETPTLIVQGTRDRFGTCDDVASYDLSDAIDVRWLETGDHSFVPSERSGRSEDELLAAAANAINRFIKETPDPNGLAKSTQTSEVSLAASSA